MKVCNAYRLLINLYIDGELDAAEARKVEQHLSECPACRRYCDEICMVNRAVQDVELPKDLHASIMSAVSAARMEDEKIVDFPKEETRAHAPARKKRPGRWIGTVAAMLAVACVGVFGMEGGLTSVFRGMGAEEAAEANQTVMEEAVTESALSAELKSAAPSMKTEMQPEETVETVETTAQQPIRIEETMTGWFIDAADHVTVLDTGAPMALESGENEPADGAEPENEAETAPELGGEAASELTDDRMTELDMLLGEGAEGYGFYLVAAGRTEELPAVFADQMEQAEAGCTLVITVRNDAEVRSQIISGLTESGFEVREDREDVWFTDDDSAEEGLVIVLLTE